MFVRVVPLALLLTSCILLSACDTGERVIRIGAAVSESGRYAEEGNHTRQGYLLWEEWVNERGGIDVGGEKYEVELILYDDGSDPGRTAELVERLIDEEEVDFILGDMRLAVEAKASSRITRDHLKGMRTLKEEHPGVQRCIVVSLEPRPRRTDDGIDILPANTFAERLWRRELAA